MIEISPTKVAHVIVRARELDAHVDNWGDEAEMAGKDPIGRELRAFISKLNRDEQAELVAVAWIGRGTYEPDEFAEAVQTAHQERTTATWKYLLGMSMLSDYLEEGLEKLGYSIEEVEGRL